MPFVSKLRVAPSRDTAMLRVMRMFLGTLAATFLCSAAIAADAPSLIATLEGQLASGPAGARYGLMVATAEGDPLIGIAADQRFVPASNTKIYTTAAAYAELAALDAAAKGTAVRTVPAPDGAVDVVLHGRGDARLSSSDDCTVDCLQTLADAVAARTRHVRDIAGDDSWYPDERWPQGMSWNNIPSRYGTAISALTLDDNMLTAIVTPGKPGDTASVDAPAYYRFDNRVRTVPGSERHISADRAPNRDLVLLTGSIGADAGPQNIHLGIDDPAHYAAWRFRALLEARGVRVTGTVQARHRMLTAADDPARRGNAAATFPPQPEMLAELPPPPLAEDMRVINKQSQNLHADLMLRRIGRMHGSGSVADGEAVLEDRMKAAGITRESYDFSDGSGMSTYNRITPRATVGLLAWIARQPWGAAWRETLPVAGRDGTLRNRFKGTLLEGRLFAKTGSLNAARAVSGYMVTRSGRTLIFSALANDMTGGTDDAATAAIDRALVSIAEAL